MLQDGDRYTFQFAELKGDAYYHAFGVVTKSFLRMYRGMKHYEVILRAFIEHLLAHRTLISSESLQVLSDGLTNHIGAILTERQAPEPTRRLRVRGPDFRRWELQAVDDGDDDEGFNDTSEGEVDYEPQVVDDGGDELEGGGPILSEQQEEKRLERERQEAERAAARERERLRNEEELRSRARQVDRRAMEELLQQVSVVNPGQKKCKEGKQQQQKQISAEAVAEIELQVALLRKEKDRVQFVLQCSEEELSSKLAEATQERDEAVSKVSLQGGVNKFATDVANMGQKLLKSRFSELTQKATKLKMELNRVLLQLKAEQNPLREELLSVLKARDEAQVQLIGA